MKTNRNLSNLDQLAAYDQSLVLVLERFEQDFEIYQQTLKHVNGDKSIHAQFLEEILRVFDNEKAFSVERLSGFPLTVILDYLNKTHHYYLNKRFWEIEHTFEQLVSRHKADFPLLELMKLAFSGYRNELIEHIELEEKHLFPYINLLIETDQTGVPFNRRKKKAQYSISRFMGDHDDDPESHLHEIRAAITKYHPQVLDMMSFRILLNQLDAFEKDLNIHARIEDEILIPKAMMLEQKLLEKAA